MLPRAHTDSGSRFWSVLVDRVTRRPLVAAALATAVLLALAYPALSLRISKPSDLALTAQSEPALQALADVRRAFPSAGETAIVAVEAPAAAQAQLRQQLHRLSRLAVDEGVANTPVDPIRTASAGSGSAAALFLPLTGNGANRSSRHAVDALRAPADPRRRWARIRGVETAVTGPTAEDIDFTRQIRHALPYVLAFVLVLAFGLLLVAFRSIVVPLKAIGLNLLSVGAAYGVLALVFQHHWAESILGFQSNGTIVSWLPLFLFVVLFGLSMDYHVFILSRVREAVDAGERTETAVRRSIAVTAGVVTAAAVVMVCVFALFGNALVARAQAGRRRPRRRRPDRRNPDPRRATPSNDETARRPELVPPPPTAVAPQARPRAAPTPGSSSGPRSTRSRDTACCGPTERKEQRKCRLSSPCR